MPRPPNLIPSVKLTTALPLDVITQMNAFLYSPLEGKVPAGSHQRFLSERIREYFNHASVDLAEFNPNLTTGALIVTGSPEAITLLRNML